MPDRRTPRTSRRPQRPHPRTGYVAVGLIRGAHGVRGELKVQSLTDFPQRFEPGATLWVAGERRTVAGSRPTRAGLLLRLQGITTREQAEALRGTLLEVPEGELAQLGAGQYFRFQLIGMSVFDTAGAALGRLEEVIETGANDVFAVRNEEGELLLPAIDSVVREVDVSNGRMVVEVPAGLERRLVKARRGDAKL